MPVPINESKLVSPAEGYKDTGEKAEGVLLD